MGKEKKVEKYEIPKDLGSYKVRKGNIIYSFPIKEILKIYRANSKGAVLSDKEYRLRFTHAMEDCFSEIPLLTEAIFQFHKVKTDKDTLDKLNTKAVFEHEDYENCDNFNYINCKKVGGNFIVTVYEYDIQVQYYTSFRHLEKDSGKIIDYDKKNLPKIAEILLKKIRRDMKKIVKF